MKVGNSIMNWTQYKVNVARDYLRHQRLLHASDVMPLRKKQSSLTLSTLPKDLVQFQPSSERCWPWTDWGIRSIANLPASHEKCGTRWPQDTYAGCGAQIATPKDFSSTFEEYSSSTMDNTNRMSILQYTRQHAHP